MKNQALPRSIVAALGSLLLLACQHPQSGTAPPISPELCSNSLLEYRRSVLVAGRAVVQVAVADLWEKPERRSSLADQAFLGELVRPIADQQAACGPTPGRADFIEVLTESGYRAWIEIAAVRPLSASDRPYRESGPLVRVAVRLGSVYSKPTVTAEKPVFLLPYDVPLRLSRAVDERWREIALPDGRAAFIQAGDVAPLSTAVNVAATTVEPAAATAESDAAGCVIEHARRYLGTPYLWGGRSTLGVDCSGLVLSSMAACGLMPPRDAGPQHDWDRTLPVPQEVAALKAGDLLFFGKREGAVSSSATAAGGAAASSSAPAAASSTAGLPSSTTPLSRRITHVGIYLGDGRFIHATTHQQPVVQESLLGDAHWTASWIASRRPPYSRR